MIVASIAACFPSWPISNAELLDQFAAANQHLCSSELAACQQRIQKYLCEAGAEVRFYRNRTARERAYPLLRNAVDEALLQAETKAADIDVLVYCGVGRGFLEPATAYFVANDLGVSCECFDILDACMSWVRALYVVHCLFASNRCSTALVVNAEFNIYECGYPGIMKVESFQQLAPTLPAYTIGEAATATVLKKSSAEWVFHFHTDTGGLPLCAVPLPNHTEYLPRLDWNLAPNGQNTFMCYGEELTSRAGRQMLRFVRNTYRKPNAFKMWFPHLATGRPYVRAGQILGLHGRMYTKTFGLYGNVVSASIPAAMAVAIKEGELNRGDHIVLCPISAGMSMALVDFIY